MFFSKICYTKSNTITFETSSFSNYAIASKTTTGTPELTKHDKSVDSQSPNTGNNSNLSFWIALLLTSCAGVIGTTVDGRKKKYLAK